MDGLGAPTPASAERLEKGDDHAKAPEIREAEEKPVIDEATTTDRLETAAPADGDTTPAEDQDPGAIAAGH